MAVSWEALKAAAESSFKEGDYAAAAAGYSQALESLPAQEGLTQERSKLLSNRCASLQKLARWEDAEHDAREAVKLAPDWEKGETFGRKARLADQLRHHNQHIVARVALAVSAVAMVSATRRLVPA